MENVPLSVEDDAESKESRRKKEEARKRLKKPENIGFLAVESDANQPSALEIAWAKTKRESDTVESDKAPPADPVERPPQVDRVDVPRVGPMEAPRIEPTEETTSGIGAGDEERADESLETPPAERLSAPPVEAVPPVPAQPDETVRSEAVVADSPPVPLEVPPVETVDRGSGSSEVVDDAVKQEREAIGVAAVPDVETEAVPHEPVEIEAKPLAEVVVPVARAETDGDADEEVPLIDHTDRRPDDTAETVTSPPRAEQPEEPPDHRQFEFRENADEDQEEPAPPIETARATGETKPAGPPEAPRLPEHMAQLFADSETRPGEQRQIPSPEAAPVPEIAKSSRAAEERMKVEAAPKGPLISRQVETLDMTELMELAEQIHIDGDDLRHIYETHLIGERGLRRLVAEYQRGGDLNEALKREVLEREMDFERDPAMRDLAAPDVASLDAFMAGEGEPSLEKLLQKASVDTTPDSAEKAAFLKARTRYQASSQQPQRHYRKAMFDVALFTFIGLLALLVIIVYLSR